MVDDTFSIESVDVELGAGIGVNIKTSGESFVTPMPTDGVISLIIICITNWIKFNYAIQLHMSCMTHIHSCD